MDIDDGGSSAAAVDWESNPVLREIFEALCKTPAINIEIFAADPVQSKSDLTVEPFCLETSASGTRRFSSHDIHGKNGFLVFLDSSARKALKEVKFVLIMDMCRVPGEFSLKDKISDPDQDKAPGCWSICYSTSRGTVAVDGDQGSHSPLVLGLLDPQSGIFAPGVSLEQGIKNACESVERKSGVGIQQRPIKINIDPLGDVIMQPAGGDNMRPLERSSHSSQLIEYLKEHQRSRPERLPKRRNRRTRKSGQNIPKARGRGRESKRKRSQ
jgi:hypothetical protein